MMSAGAITDFELLEAGSEIFVRVWSQQPRDNARLRKQVSAILPIEIDENHVLIVE